MIIAGIVAEYNPFHNGHEAHIAATRALLGGDAGVVCCMSGDFVQRGEAAQWPKLARAEAAVRQRGSVQHGEEYGDDYGDRAEALI